MTDEIIPTNDKLQIRNSTVDFLVFTRDAKVEGIEVIVTRADHTKTAPDCQVEGRSHRKESM